MSIDRYQHDQELDKILAALRDAAPPEGMEARIAQRLQKHVAAPQPASFRWRNAFADSTTTGAWWRGAITGAVAMLLMAATFLVAAHLLQTHPDRLQTATDGAANRNAATPVSDSSHSAQAGDIGVQPCTKPLMLRTASALPPYTSDALRAETLMESDAPSHPAPPLPLTAQERALVRLMQTASPTQLAVISPAEYANLEAQSALKFEKYFAPPAPPPTTDGNAAVDSPATPAANSEDKPELVEENPIQTKEEQ